MKNLSQLLRSAQEMQSKMAEMQERLAALEVEGAAGGGMVGVTMTAKGEVRALRIDPALVDPAEVSVLEDLIVAAMGDARRKADVLMQEEMGKMAGGLPLPEGFKLPF